MNAPLSLSSFQTNERDIFNQLKLQMLEAFYQLDVALEDWIHDGGGDSGGASTGCRLKKLLETSFTDKVATKAQLTRFAKLPAELETAIRLRNLLVHCEAKLGVLEGRPAFFLCPVDHAMRANGYVAITDIEKITAAVKAISDTAKTLSSWRKQRDAKAPAAPAPDRAEPTS